MGATSSRATTKASAVAPPAPAPTHAPSVSLTLTDPKDYYVVGDVIQGCITLEFDVDTIVTSLGTSLGYTQKSPIFPDNSWEDLTESHIQSPTPFAAGRHCIPFSHTMANMVRVWPSSFALKYKPDTGIFWNVFCFLDVDGREYLASRAITFRASMPRPSYLAQWPYHIFITCAGLRGQIWHPCEIPQAPDPCEVGINLQAVGAPVVVNRIAIYLAGTLTAWGTTATTDTVYELIGEFAHPVLVAGTLQLDAAQLDCRMRRFYPQAFIAANMCLTYSLVFEIQTHKVIEFRFRNVWLAGASAKSTEALAIEDSTLPAYAER